MKMYRTRLHSTDIREVEVERSTDVSIFTLKGRREAKHSTFTNFYDTFAEAKAALLKRYTVKITSLEQQIKQYGRELDTVIMKDQPDQGRDFWQ